MKYKVFRREVYTFTFKQWIKATIWCHLVIKIFPKCHDFGSDALVESYRKKPKLLHEQLKHLFY